MISGVSRALVLLLSTSTVVLARSDIAQRSTSPIAAQAAPLDYFTENVIGCTNLPGGQFSFLWGNVENVAHPVCGKGWSVGTRRTINYKGDYWPGGESKLFAYGWTRNPLVEYFVMDSFGYYTQSPDVKIIGNATCNGVLFDVLTGTLTNQPSIDGIKTFPQFWSARRGILRGPVSGSIDLDCHFKAWESLGLKIGSSFAYQIAAVDTLWSNGRANLTITSS